MERFELARIIHQERMRALEVELHRRRLLQASDDAVDDAAIRTTAEATAQAPHPTATHPTADQRVGSAPRRSSPLTR